MEISLAVLHFSVAIVAAAAASIAESHPPRHSQGMVPLLAVTVAVNGCLSIAWLLSVVTVE